MPKKSTFVALLLLAVLLGQFFPAVQTASAATCDAAQFVADMTVPDGSAYSPNAAFTKTWRLKNIGTCTWNTSYQLVYASGPQMGGQSPASFTSSVAPGATIDLSVNLTAPVPPGTYRGFWQLKNASGALFGIGATADKPFWVEVVTRPGSAVTPVPFGDSYNFATQSSSAQNWMSGAGTLAFGGADGDARGFVQKLDSVTLETGATVNQPSLLMVPQTKTDGYIQGLYPSLPIQNGDRFQATVGCQSGASACYVTYRVDYRTSAGTATLWTWKEKYDGLSYNVDKDLSFLAGKNVEFFLLILASGSPTGDRALWVNPRIVHTGSGNIPTNTPTPVTGTPPTPTNTPTGPTNTPVPHSTVDRATFIADKTVPDGTTFAANTNFTKVWSIKNTGSSTWTTSYKLVFVSGDQMSGPLEQNLTSTIAPNTTVQLSVNLTAPGTAGTHRGYWQLKNASGALFGIGSGGNMPFWVDIMVTGGSIITSTPTVTGTPVTPTATPSGPTSTPIPGTLGYDFASNALSDSSWTSGAGALPFPGTDGDARGFAQKLDSVTLETGATVNQPSLLMVPQTKTDGYIQGLFKAVTVQNGDHFQATIGCQSGATACFVTYRIDYRTSAGTATLWTWKEKYDGLSYNVDKDLSFLAGKSTQFFLLILASGSPTGDRALWVDPRIVHTGSSGPTPAPTATSTPYNGNWLTYTNATYQFQFQYPPEGQVSVESDNSVQFSLPIVPNTNLDEKFLGVSVTENATTCTSPLDNGYAPGSTNATPVSFNGISFTREKQTNGAAGHFRNWTAYSTLKGTTCISLGFELRATNPMVYPTPPPSFDENAESAVFAQIMSTFAWISP